MNQINVYFEDDEMLLLREAKGKQTWHDFVMRLAIIKEADPHD